MDVNFEQLHMAMHTWLNELGWQECYSVANDQRQEVHFTKNGIRICGKIEHGDMICTVVKENLANLTTIISRKFQMHDNSIFDEVDSIASSYYVSSDVAVNDNAKATKLKLICLGKICFSSNVTICISQRNTVLYNASHYELNKLRLVLNIDRSQDLTIRIAVNNIDKTDTITHSIPTADLLRKPTKTIQHTMIIPMR